MIFGVVILIYQIITNDLAFTKLIVSWVRNNLSELQLQQFFYFRDASILQISCQQRCSLADKRNCQLARQVALLSLDCFTMRILLTRASERKFPLRGKVPIDGSLVEIDRYITSMYCAAEAVKSLSQKWYSLSYLRCSLLHAAQRHEGRSSVRMRGCTVQIVPDILWSISQRSMRNRAAATTKVKIRQDNYECVKCQHRNPGNGDSWRRCDVNSDEEHTHWSTSLSFNMLSALEFTLSCFT